MMMDSFGPEWWRDHIVTGDAATKAKRKVVESQLIMDSVVWKYWAEDAETGAKEIQSQETMILRRTSWARPKKRRL